MINKKIILDTVLLGLMMLIFSSCYEGYIAAEGDHLKKYLEPESLKELTENPKDDIRLIDVRPAGAYLDGHILTAESFPSSEIMDRLDELPKETSYIIYCETGGRAQAVIKKLEEAGYKKLMNWGGYTRWPYDFVKAE